MKTHDKIWIIIILILIVALPLALDWSHYDYKVLFRLVHVGSIPYSRTFMCSIILVSIGAGICYAVYLQLTRHKYLYAALSFFGGIILLSILYILLYIGVCRWSLFTEPLSLTDIATITQTELSAPTEVVESTLVGKGNDITGYSGCRTTIYFKDRQQFLDFVNAPTIKDQPYVYPEWCAYILHPFWYKSKLLQGYWCRVDWDESICTINVVLD